jgi:thiamine biosynthesis lipoprotein
VEKSQAEKVVRGIVAEIERLEAVFSLYDPRSELSRLNRDGLLRGPSHDFRLLLETSLEFWTRTDGAFNPAIQPVWRHLAQHFETTAADPDPLTLHRFLKLCDPSRITMSPSRIILPKGMALTFNGIAQGYITDRAANLMRGQGLSHVLVNLGEFRALPGRPWHIRVDQANEPVFLRDGALAQSSGWGTVFTADGRWHHLIDPRTGRSGGGPSPVTIAAPEATVADALSTALYVTPPQARGDVLRRFRDARLL